MKETSKAVSKSREAAGRRSTSFYLTDAERETLTAFTEEIGAKSQREAIFEAIAKYRAQGKISKAQILAEIERRLK